MVFCKTVRFFATSVRFGFFSFGLVFRLKTEPATSLVCVHGQLNHHEADWLSVDMYVCVDICLDVCVLVQLNHLHHEADRLSVEKPEEAAIIRKKIAELTGDWEALTQMVSVTVCVCVSVYISLV